jgi:hypothetical protein
MVHAGLVGRRNYPRPVEISLAHRPLPASYRAFHRVLKLARAISDLARSAPIQPAHLYERSQPTDPATETLIAGASSNILILKS